MKRAVALLLLAIGVAVILALSLYYDIGSGSIAAAEDGDCFFAGQWICH